MARRDLQEAGTSEVIRWNDYRICRGNMAIPAHPGGFHASAERSVATCRAIVRVTNGPVATPPCEAKAVERSGERLMRVTYSPTSPLRCLVSVADRSQLGSCG